MSRMVDRMVKRELISRSPIHRINAVILALTDKGLLICERFVNEALVSIINELTARLTPDESRQLVDLMTKCCQTRSSPLIANAFKRS